MSKWQVLPGKIWQTYVDRAAGLHAAQTKLWEYVMSEQEVTRCRSFVERYVIERAATFRVDQEEQDAWECILRAKSIYKKIEGSANEFRQKVKAADEQQL